MKATKRVFLIIGTRPEAIKMAPLYLALRRKVGLTTTLVSTGQHRELVREALEEFGLRPDVDLDVMKPGQSLSGLTAAILSSLEGLFAGSRPDQVLVHGDTTTSFSAALSCFYHGIRASHVEAGLRSRSLSSPYPEEFNRMSISRIVEDHFAPSVVAKNNLQGEGVRREAIHLTGNTILDALRFALNAPEPPPVPDIPFALLTLHRRDLGPEAFVGLLSSVGMALDAVPAMPVVFPLHPSPRVREACEKILGTSRRFLFRPPMAYRKFVQAMSRARVVLTDSGGIQEETGLLGTPAVLLRDRTDRQTDGAFLSGYTTEGIRESLGKALSFPRSPFRRFPSGSPSRRIASLVAEGTCT